MKIEIRVVSDGERVYDDFTENVEIPKGAVSYTYQFHDEHGMRINPIKKVFLPRPRMVKREGWVNVRGPGFAGGKAILVPGCVYSTKEDVEKYSRGDGIIIRIEWEEEQQP